MDKISDHRERIRETMDLLNQGVQAESDGYDDLLNALDTEIAEDKMRDLPNVNGTAALPVQQNAQVAPRVMQADDDIDNLLAAL